MRGMPGVLLAVVIVSPGLSAQTGAGSPHGKTSITITCEACHTAVAWKPTRSDMQFDHNSQTAFQLTGRHRQVGCEGCHLDLRFDEPRVEPGNCAVCHVDVHQNRMGQECAACHDTDAFTSRPALDAHARTSFPLTGMHAQISCQACHQDERVSAYKALDPTCIGCHRDDYAATTFPDHSAASYPVDCRACHRTISWHGAVFDHSATGFELIGAHASAACASCHVPPQQSVPHPPAGPNDCVACHQADYSRAHLGTDFPNTCVTCHTQNRWSEIVFDHDAAFFRIFSGGHRGRWRNCADCHSDPQNFAVFTCLTCHTRSDMDEHHKETAGYVYESTQCLACHRRGTP